MLWSLLVCKVLKGRAGLYDTAVLETSYSMLRL